jgi:hypothetical protein
VDEHNKITDIDKELPGVLRGALLRLAMERRAGA